MNIQQTINQIFVDFENTQLIDLSLTHNKAVKITFLIGDKQKHLPIQFVKQLVIYSQKIQLIETQSAGKNALDFILAFYLGQACYQHKNHAFYIVSKDKGYDSLVQHLRLSDVKIERYDEFSQIPLFTTQKVQNKSITHVAINHKTVSSIKQKELISEKLQIIIEYLRKNTNNRPKKQDSLVNFLKSHLKTVTLANIDQLILQEMVRKTIVTIDNKSVTYNL